MPRRNADLRGTSSARWVGWLWYRGEAFRGFQRQLEGPTVQATLENALREVGVETTVVGAGRTDRGVHARMQVIGCRLPSRDARDAVRWQAALAERLPSSVGLAAFRPAPPRFHPQFSADRKVYRYRVSLGDTERAGCWTPARDAGLGRAPDPSRVVALLREAVGTRDFFAFHPSSSARRPRALFCCDSSLTRDGVFELTLEGDGFARHQVRYLVGGAVATALGVLSVDQWRAALERAEPLPGIRAPADGLTLWEVRYPEAVDPFTAEERARLPGALYEEKSSSRAP